MANAPQENRSGEKRIQYDAVKARLYPTAEQEALFEKTFDCCRYIWNRMLADQERFYLETGTHFIPTPAKYKKEAPFLREVDNQALTQEYNRLAQAFRLFFRDPEHFRHPRYKSRNSDSDSFTACNHDFPSGPTLYVTGDGVRLTKAGIVRAKLSRKPRAGWKLKRVTVERTPSGRYFACLLYEHPVRTPEPVSPRPETTLDLGSAGGGPPPQIAQSREKLARLQEKLDRMQKGSRNYEETLRKCRELREHIANQQRDWLHKESRRIADSYDAVNVGADGKAAPGLFREMLRYKLDRRGKQLIEETE